ncbi:MAG: cysteine hydrolase family protein [Caldisericia bacterium]
MEKIDLKRSALLIIDMEYGFLDKSSPLFVQNSHEIIPNIKKILNLFRKKKLSVIFIKREHRKSGVDIDKTRIKIFKENRGIIIENDGSSEIIKELKPKSDEIIVIKRRWSAFFGTELDLILRRLNIKNLIITGVQTPNCIRATVFDALSYDYDVIVISDGTASNNTEIQKNNLSDMENIGVKILNTDEFINFLNKF